MRITAVPMHISKTKQSKAQSVDHLAKQNCYVEVRPTVHFTSRWYLSAWGSPYVPHPVSEKFPHCSVAFEMVLIMCTAHTKNMIVVAHVS